MSHKIPEPPIHDDDTSPSLAVHPVGFNEPLPQADIDHEGEPTWRHAVGWLSLLGAMVFTLATVVILFIPQDDTSEQNQRVSATTQVSVPTIPASVEPVTATEVRVQTDDGVDEADSALLPPVVFADQLGIALQAPLEQPSRFVQAQYNPFTVVNTDRPRSEFVNHTVVQGETIDEISKRFGLQPESLAWCNDRRIVQVLRPGDVLRIPPVDGACHQVFGTREETIERIARDYNVDDPYTIIDSEYNRNQLPSDVTPTDLLLGGTNLFIPNGEGPVITWDAGSQETDASGNVIGVGFANGQPGSCGSVTPSTFVGWGNPLPTGTWVRGFYAGHSGIDLSAATGTPIYAASSGNVLFSGFSRWGYGEAVVIEHGGTYSTLYGHMSARNVSCGQFVTIGQLIGYVGSTGNSSGPHLHFEIQVNGNAVNPSGTPGVGW